MADEYEKYRENARITRPGPPSWPTGVRSITLEGLALMGIGSDNKLYWDGQQLEVSRKVSLSWWQTRSPQ